MKCKFWLAIIFSVLSSTTFADGSSIGKIYLPYVQPLEKEFEYLQLFENKNREQSKNIKKHTLGYGVAVSDRFFLEGSLNYIEQASIKLESYELEAIYQLTEQGEYNSDWGLLMALEKANGRNNWEAAIGVLNNKSWRHWQLNTNVLMEYEWGNNIRDEVEVAFSAQGKFRYRPEFEPGIEIFAGEDTLAAGPAFGGVIRGYSNHKLFWQLAALFGRQGSPAKTLKLQLEYEFF